MGVSGNLRNSDLIMYDRQTQSWWQQLTGEGIVGTLAGRELTILPASIIAWSDFKEANPDSPVLSRATGFSRRYGENPYSGYDRVDNPPFLFRGDMDSRLLPKERSSGGEHRRRGRGLPVLAAGARTGEYTTRWVARRLWSSSSRARFPHWIDG